MIWYVLGVVGTAFITLVVWGVVSAVKANNGRGD
jgi:hypothetical protein